MARELSPRECRDPRPFKKCKFVNASGRTGRGRVERIRKKERKNGKVTGVRKGVVVHGELERRGRVKICFALSFYLGPDYMKRPSSYSHTARDPPAATLLPATIIQYNKKIK